jgi:glutamine cyclotransferase
MPDTSSTLTAAADTLAPNTTPAQPAEVVRTYGPFAKTGSGRGECSVAGVTHDGERVWAATGAQLIAIDPASGNTVHTLDCAGDAGTAYDGKHLWQIAESHINRIDPATGRVLGSIPAPSPSGSNSGLAWAEGSLWVGQYRDRTIHRIDPATGAVQATIRSNRFVTGVTWVDGELWHGTWEGGESDIRQIDPADGTVLQRLQLPAGEGVSGLESDGAGLFYAGSGPTGTVRAVRRPKARASAAAVPA